MRDLDTKIAEWRSRMAAGGVKDVATLDELEGHLREDVQQRLTAGDSSAEAFEFATARIGTPNSLHKEFNKISGATTLPVVIGTSTWAVLTIWVAVIMTGKVLRGNINLLLWAQIMALAAGYLATFLAGAFAIYFVCRRWRGKLSPAAQSSLGRAVLHFSGIAAGLTVLGLILGMVWSAKNRGAYWSGLPMEIGPLMASIWFLATWVIQRFGWKDIYTRMLVCLGGNILGALCWFGIGHQTGDPGLRHIADFWPLQVFVGAHLLPLALAFSRRFEAVKPQIN